MRMKTMSNHQSVRLVASVLGTLVVVAPAVAHEVQMQGVDARHYEVESPAAQELVGENVIPRRSDNYTFEGGEVLRPVFASLDDLDAIERLHTRAAEMLGDEALGTDPIDIGGAFGLQTETGIAWVAKNSGAMSIKRNDYERGISQIDNAEMAVDRALVVLAESGFRLDERVSLDVVDIGVIRRAAWVEHEGGALEPVVFRGERDELVTDFDTSFIVVFGRRYAGVPILGSKLVVRLDSDGEAAAILQHWRDIIERREMETINVAEALEEQAAGLEDGLEVAAVECGLVEAEVIGYGQEQAGVACRSRVVDPSKAGEMGAAEAAWINLSVNPEENPLEGELLHLVPELDEPEDPEPPDFVGPECSLVVVDECDGMDCMLWIEDFESGVLAAPWTTWGNADWFAQSDIAYEQSSAAESGNITDNQDSYLETVVDFPVGGNVSFWHSGDTEGYWDFLEFRIDGIVQFEQSGSWGWTHATYPVAAGLHAFEWRYLKDGSVSRGADTVWIDDVQMPGATP